ncbi:unnamed protein product [Ceutorhynchus assimilis]|uniref:Protein male-specific lethal-3 n=1 Tax=Ceutorhynchus assimilis TaxID=467358 RepID=A0A9N9QDK9_9CUCU|nr:unnamed protein product [Ceutorhynchus assimilis]
MVSRRGVKLKFFIGERVLCYEPDTTKAKVLYDSKVLDVVITKDQVSGKKIIEYLIHFQGWNPSWDRRVNEEFVLKDTPENRQLQKDLADKAQLQLGAYLYRKERKKHNQPKPLENAIGSSEEGSSGSPAHMDTDDNPEMSSSSDNSSVEDDEIVIEIVPELKEILEADYYLINVKNRRLKLPTEPNVVAILESYYRHYVTNQFCGLNEKSHSRNRTSLNIKESKPKTEDIQKNLTLCREVIDGLRIYFDFKVNELLLYKVEKDDGLYITKPAVMPYNLQEVKVSVKLEQNNAISTNNIIPNGNHNTENGTFSGNPRRRTLRSSNRIEPRTNGNSLVEETNGTNHAKRCPSIGSSNSDINAPMTKALSWRLLPDPIKIQQPPPPCLVYGAIHFARLFVKLPELLGRTSIPDPKLKIILSHVDSIIDFLNDHKEWYGEKHYVDATV